MPPTTSTISGLGLDIDANIDDTTVLPVDNKLGVTKKITLAMLRFALGLITFTGDVTGSGRIGSIALTLATNIVTLSKFQQIPSGYILGRSTASTGNVEVIQIGSGLILSAGILYASTAAAAAPSTTRVTRRAFRGY